MDCRHCKSQRPIHVSQPQSFTTAVFGDPRLDLTADALGKNPTLAGIAPYVEDSGEGRWTAAEAIDLNLAAPVITLSLLERLRSRDDDSFADKLLAAMRNEFGGHRIKAE